MNRRYVELDAMRGLAAITVFLSHYFGAINSAPFGSLYSANPLGILWNGHSAVMFFFILSGFVLSLPYVNSDRPFKLLEFYVKRVFRIYPAYIFAILLACCLKYYLFSVSGIQTYDSWIKYMWQWSFDNDHLKTLGKTLLIIGPKFDTDLIDPAIWSLVVEMKISIFIPFFIIIANRCNFTFNAIFLFVLVYLNRDNGESTLYIFYAGILLAKYKNSVIDYTNKLSKWTLFALILFIAVAYNLNYELTQTRYNKTFSTAQVDHVLALGSFLFLCIVISKQSISTFLTKKVFVFLGEISYGFYLIHSPVLYVVCSRIPLNKPFNAVLVLVVCIVIGFIISYLIFKCIEMPFQRIGKKLVDKSKFFSAIQLK